MGAERVKEKSKGRFEHMKNSIIFLLAWLVVFLILVNQLKEANGIPHLITTVQNGDYFPVLLVVSSIVLLALSIRSLFLYLRYNAMDKNKNL